MSEPAAVCAGCQREVAERPFTWSLQTTAAGTTWLCDRCTRENVRAIEGRLDAVWW